MLDSATKKRIDDLRNILVGKIPSPQSQVEQITTGLVYKFMYDMDQEAIELGGVPSFFVGDYEKYSWKNLFDTKLSGIQRVQLYGDAIEHMYTNPTSPPLFREIFKNSFLPFKDPSTLNMFLKEINEFHYSHSEKLGDAFEYLLSFMGSQGDAGQFRTPRHIIDFIVEIINPQKNETILDPACGTAGFLISSYKHILQQNTNKKSGDKLTASDRKQIGENLVGYDISPDMTRISLVNMYLHQFASPQIHEYDTLSSEDRWNEYYDVILANPPFFSPTGGIQPHSRFGVQSTRAEVLFVDYIMEHLKPKGRAGIIVPEGIVFQTGNAYKSLRKKLVENSLIGVISLPAGIFQPYSGVKTSILILDKQINQRSNHIFFTKIENDGFSLGAQRTAIKGSELDSVSSNIKEYLLDNNSSKLFTVPKDIVINEKNSSLNASLYEESKTYEHSSYETFELGEICNFINGLAFKPTDWCAKDIEGSLPIVRIQNLNNKNAEFNYTTRQVSDKYLIENNDLLFSWSGSRDTSFGAHIWTGGKSLLNQHIFKVEFDKNKISKTYLFYALNKCVEEVKNNLHGGVGLVHITKGNLEKIKIPVPPLSIQEEIIDELNRYQKIIDGSKQVIENYKPSIKVMPSWKKTPLGEVCEFAYGKPLKESDRIAGDYDVFGSNGVVGSHNSYLVKHPFIVIGRKGSAGEVNFSQKNGFPIDTTFYISQDQLKRDDVDLEFLYYTLQSINLSKASSQQTIPGLNRNDAYSILIAIPDIQTQRQIVLEIQSEKQLVNNNIQLIDGFLKKIHQKINSVWGEE